MALRRNSAEASAAPRKASPAAVVSRTTAGSAGTSTTPPGPETIAPAGAPGQHHLRHSGRMQRRDTAERLRLGGVQEDRLAVRQQRRLPRPQRRGVHHPDHPARVRRVERRPRRRLAQVPLHQQHVARRRLGQRRAHLGGASAPAHSVVVMLQLSPSGALSTIEASVARPGIATSASASGSAASAARIAAPRASSPIPATSRTSHPGPRQRHRLVQPLAARPARHQPAEDRRPGRRPFPDRQRLVEGDVPITWTRMEPRA